MKWRSIPKRKIKQIKNKKKKQIKIILKKIRKQHVESLQHI